MNERRVLLASQNPDEIAELRAILADAPVDCLTPDDAGVGEVDEGSGGNYADRATRRAKAYAEASKLPALALCGGIEVFALNLEPGALTATFGGRGATDATRRDQILGRLEQTPAGQRIAVGRAAAAIAEPDGTAATSTSLIECEVPLEARGDGGYSLDAITQLVSGQTLAELSEADRMRLGHRGKALRALLPKITGEG